MSILNKKNLDYFLELNNTAYKYPSFFDLNNYLNKDKLIIISWLEWVWKTEVIASFIKSEWKTEKILYFNTDIDIFWKIKEKKDLERMLSFYIKENNEPEFIILEKIQKINDVDLFIKDLFLSGKYKIILIWNNIKVPGKPDIEILPNHLSEYWHTRLEQQLKYWSIIDIKDDISNKYMLELMLNKILLQDIFYAFDVRNIDLFKSVLAVVATNNEYTSLRDFQKFFKRYNIVTSLATTIDYIDYLISWKIIKKIAKYDIKKWKEILWKNKYYFTDLWIKNSILNYNLNTYELTENYIYNILSLLWHKVCWWVNWVFNFSFIAFKNGEKILIEYSKNNNWSEIQSIARKLIKTWIVWKKYIIINNNEKLNIRKNYRWVGIVTLKNLPEILS